MKAFTDFAEQLDTGSDIELLIESLELLFKLNQESESVLYIDLSCRHYVNKKMNGFGNRLRSMLINKQPINQQIKTDLKLALNKNTKIRYGIKTK